MVIKTVYHFVDSNLELRYPQKRGVNRKRRGEVLEVVLPWVGGECLTLEKEGFAWGTRGRDKLYRLIIK